MAGESTGAEGTQSGAEGMQSAQSVGENITLPVAQYQAFLEARAKLAEFERSKQLELDAKENARLKAMAEKDGAEKALAEQRTSLQQKLDEERQRYESLDRQVLAERLDSTISSALVGVAFAGKTAEEQQDSMADLLTIVKPRFESVRDSSGAVVVREKGTMKPAADVLKDIVASPRFARYFAATSKGGAGHSGGNQAAKTSEEPKAGSLEAIAADYKRRLGEYQSFGLGRVS